MNTELLKEIGLTDGETKVYIALFKIGSSSTGNIVKESKVHSSKVYPILDRLIEKGLVSFIKEGKKTIYSANPPTTIMSYLDKRQDKIQEQKKQAQSLVKELELLSTINRAKTEATVFKGAKGLKEAYTLATKNLKKGEKVYSMYLPPLENRLRTFFRNFVLKLLNEYKVEQYMLFNEPSPESEFLSQFKDLKIRIGVPQEYESPAEVCVYGDNTVISTTGSNEHITLLIKNKEISDSFRNQFMAFWKQDAFLSRGDDSLIRAHKKTYDKLKRGEEYLVLGIPPYQPQEHHDYWMEDHVKRAKAGIKCRLLFNQGTDKKILANRNSYGDCDSRYMPTDIKTPSYIFIYKNTVVMSIAKKDPIVIEIENQEIADSYRAYFEAFWKQTKPFKK